MKNKILLELVWWIATAVIVTAIMFPVWSEVSAYPQHIHWFNVAYITLFVTFTRHIFLLQYTFIAKLQEIKVILAVVAFLSTIFLIDGLTTFQILVDEEGYEAICKGAADERVLSLGIYIRNQYMFFGTGTIIAAIIFGFRMLISVWRVKNRGTV